MESGKSRPALIQCRDAHGNDAGFYVVKLFGSMESKETAFMCEFAAYHLAALLGIPTPEPAIVNIEKDFVEAMEPNIQRQFTASICLNFATKFKSPGFSTWPIDKPIPRNIFQVCAEIFAFDVLIQNPDRTRDNPNLLCGAEEIYAYDHETAFSFIFDIMAQKNPVENLTTQNLGFLKKHVFFNGLRKQEPNYARLEGAMLGVTASAFAEISHQVPKAWRNAHLDSILKYTETMCKSPATLTKTAKELLA